MAPSTRNIHASPIGLGRSVVARRKWLHCCLLRFQWDRRALDRHTGTGGAVLVTFPGWDGYALPPEIGRMIASGALRVCFDSRILTEHAEVLARPTFQFSPDQTHALLEQIKAEGLSVAGDPLPPRHPDPTDEPFLKAAVAGGAECVITGNTKHFPAARRQGMAVLAPIECLDHYRKRAQKRKGETAAAGGGVEEPKRTDPFMASPNPARADNRSRPSSAPLARPHAPPLA